MRYIGAPHSEESGGDFLLSNQPTGKQHYLSRTERDIFSRIQFIDYGYFYDTDKVWYYVIPEPVRIKIPLELISNNLDEDDEFEFCSKVRLMVAEKMLETSSGDVSVQRAISERGLKFDKIKEAVINDKFPVRKIWNNFRFIFDTFDDWCVVDCDEECKNITQIRLHVNNAAHIETIEWNQ